MNLGLGAQIPTPPAFSGYLNFNFRSKMAKMIPKIQFSKTFKGDGTQDAQVFLEEYKEFGGSCGWEDADLLKYIGHYLKDSAEK